ncbi:3-oxo-5-alpha-steroid 4-dehydrogenase 2a [Brachionichthys hirsutus]|uniref:3-oxo-5-alpha-steroid 4-dehydrogenase 2a n=1 Tax=Brachionichthys hirsutus TaxID=412623 RepID=UPI00360508AA
MECQTAAVSNLSWSLFIGGVVLLLRQRRSPSRYGRYAPAPAAARCCPARLAWFLQEAPAFLLPLLLLGTSRRSRQATGPVLLLCTFMLHYFHRSFIFAFLSRGRPVPLRVVLYAAVFCSLNGFLQGHHLLHCAQYELTWPAAARMAAGLFLFAVGMSINIHSDIILRRLRRPGETAYCVPRGGMFDFVSGANFFGEILEWFGYAVAVWSAPAFAFAVFTACSIGPRAYQHHRDYQRRFDDYPRSRKALIPFVF